MKSAFALLLAASAIEPACAVDLTGTTVTLDSFFPDLATNNFTFGSATVGSGIEFTLTNGYYATFDFSSDSLAITLSQQNYGFAHGDFNGFRVTFGSATPSTATLDAASTGALTDYSLAGNALYLNLAGQPESPGATIIVDFDVPPPPPPSVPEPASWMMMVGGFGLAGAGLRRRKVAIGFGR